MDAAVVHDADDAGDRAQLSAFGYTHFPARDHGAGGVAADAETDRHPGVSAQRNRVLFILGPWICARTLTAIMFAANAERRGIATYDLFVQIRPQRLGNHH